MGPIQIALVDDHRLFRSGIASLINNLKGYKVIFEAGNGQELIDKISPALKPDVILLDINMPGMDGKATAQWVKNHYPEINIIVLSMYKDPERVLAMVRLGVKGYLIKDSEPAEFEQALQKVSTGEVYYPDFVTRLLITNNYHDFELAKLNSKELKFLKLAATELTYKEIAVEMDVGVRTIDGYRDALFDKLEIKSRIGLALFAIKNKIIDL